MMYCPMSSDGFVMVKKSGSHAGIKLAIFGELAHCSKEVATEALVGRVVIIPVCRQ